MISRHPFGVGANNYVVVANVEGFNAAANVPWEGWHAIVHNVYLLVAAETGWFGLFAFLFLLIQPMIVAFRCGWRSRRDQRGDLLLGFGVALLTVYIHSLFEWVLISDLSQYLLAIEIGMVAGLAEQLGYWRKAYPRHVPYSRRHFVVQTDEEPRPTAGCHLATILRWPRQKKAVVWTNCPRLNRCATHASCPNSHCRSYCQRRPE